MRTRKVKDRVLNKTWQRNLFPNGKLRLSGELQGRASFLRFTDKEDSFLGSLNGRSLYRLAKAIVRQWEEK